MIKEIGFWEDSIYIIEEKKFLFKKKEHNTKINLSKISKIERIVEHNILVGIVLWHNDIVLHAIGVKNYEKSLQDVYDMMINNLKGSSIEFTKTEL